MPDLPPKLRELLDAAPLAGYRERVLAGVRTCWRIEWERVRRTRVGALGKLLGRRAQPPALSLAASKMGGIPYLEDPADWPKHDDGTPALFVGQINFAELPPITSAAPRRGIFVLFTKYGVDDHYVWRWYPSPKEGSAYRGGVAGTHVATGPSSEDWESRLLVRGAVSAPFDAFWNDPWPDEHEHHFDALSAWDGDHGGNLGAWTVATIGQWVNATWYGAEQKPGERWVQIWDQKYESWRGSVTSTVVARVEDFEAGCLDRCAVVRG